jgi:hypothetical protein
MLASHNRDHPSGGHFNGTYAPVREPSTASIADLEELVPAVDCLNWLRGLMNFV